MKKVVFGVIALALLALVVVVVNRFFLNKEEVVPTPTDVFGNIIAPSGTPASSGTKTITTASGTSVTVPDFTKGRTPLESDSDTYYDLVHEGPLFGDEGDTFGVQYQEGNSFFLVSLLTEPLGSARTEAETFLMKKLNLSQGQLCQLNYTVVVTSDVNSIYSEKGNLGFSFCPGAVKLP
jgi:hypothetical protein